MSKNLVICLDGTNNEFGIHNTNVVRLYQSLTKDEQRQPTYYDPGVGTMWEPGTLTRCSRKMQTVLGLAFGLGATRNVIQAYEFLMRNHEPGDKLFIFGFSRGALEARALAALLWKCGLLNRNQTSLVPYAVRLFQSPGNDAVASGFKDTFSRDVDTHFLGLWDTVTSMGNVFSPVHWPYSTNNPGVRSVRHAIALDERRSFFRQNRWGGSSSGAQDAVEAWFPGVHCDVGGGYAACEGRLWVMSLEWMAREALKAGLLIDPQRLSGVLSEGKDAWGDVPDYSTGDHDSMLWWWMPVELVPKPHSQRHANGSYASGWIWPFAHAGFKGRPRSLFKGELVHRSAIQRFADRKEYRPSPLLKAGLNENAARTFLCTSDEFWTVP